jgi:molybdopterin-binding protein
VIRLEQLEVSRGSFHLGPMDLSVPAESYALVIGPTGAGKSTLIEAIAGHLGTAAGAITIGGVDATHLPPEARGVGVVYQRHHLFPHLTVAQNIGYGLKRIEPTEARRTARIDELAAVLGIEALLGRSIADLSGGERQRVALARALAPRPRLLLLDEPLTAIDPRTRRRLREELHRIHALERATVVHVTHDFEDALRLGSLVAVLNAGRIVQQGPPGLVFREPATAFVADFIGSGNVLAGDVREVAGRGSVFASGPIELEVVTERRGPCHAMIRPEEILVSRTELPSPPRNHLRGRVVRVERVGALATVHLDVGLPLVAHLTRRSVDEMGLDAGQPALAAVKATAVHIM